MKLYLVTERDMDEHMNCGGTVRATEVPADAKLLTRAQVDAAVRKHVGGQQRQLLAQALLDELFGPEET